MLKFNNHFELEGKHAFLSASKYSWIRYTNEKLYDTFFNAMAAQRGTELHNLASELIRLGIKLPSSKKTLNMYVNDALGFRMTPEQTLFYSPNAFGTADAISFKMVKKTGRHLLRIHDLKTGVGKASVNQLEIYVAFFCLEYGFKPFEIDVELRIYQNDYIQIYEPDPVDIVEIMDKTVTFDKIINDARMEAAL